MVKNMMANLKIAGWLLEYQDHCLLLICIIFFSFFFCYYNQIYMCGRFINLNKVDKINKIFEIDKLENFQNLISYNIAPSQSTIIITNAKSLKIEKACWVLSKYDEKNNIKKNFIK